MPIEHDSRQRLVARQDLLDRRHRRRQLRRIQTQLAIRRRVSSRQVQVVAITQRHVEGRGQRVEHVAARRAAAGLDEADVARGHTRGGSEIELAHATMLPPRLQDLADRAAVARAACVMPAHYDDIDHTWSLRPRLWLQELVELDTTGEVVDEADQAREVALPLPARESTLPCIRSPSLPR